MALPSNAQMPARLKNFRWDLVAVGAASLGIWLLFTSLGNAFFVQIDSAAHDYAALAWLQNCWDFVTEKYLSVWLISLTYHLFGPSPYWGTFWLAIAAGLSGLLVYEITRLITQSRLTGVLAALILLALPGYQAFDRTYFGYLFPFLLLGWLGILKGHWWWAGLCFGLAIEGHFNTAIPVGFSCLITFLLFFREVNWKSWVVMALGVLTPWALTELLFFIYLGPGSFPVYTRFTLNIILHPQVGDIVERGIDWIPRALVGINGWLGFILILPSLAAFWLVRQNKKALALTLSFLVLPLYYTFQGGFTQAVVVPRLLVSSIPFWCIGAAIVWVWLAGRLPTAARPWVVGIFIAGVAVSALQTQIYVRAFTQTPNDQIQAWFAQAKAANKPVRFNGNPRVGMYYAYYYGVETLANDRRWSEANQPNGAVLIFTFPVPPTVTQDGYTVTTYDHPTPEDQTLPVLTKEISAARHIELWWPSGPAQPVKPDTYSPYGGFDATYYYAGTGCSSVPAYGNGTLWFYQLVILKIKERLGLATSQ